MLVLSRKPGESIQIASNITVKVLKTVGSNVRIGIEAPDNIRILRSEIAQTSTVPFSKKESSKNNRGLSTA